MPYRKVIFTDGEIYHVFNRSVNKETIFNNKKEIDRFFSLINFYQFKSNISYSRYCFLDKLQQTSIKKLSTFSNQLVEIYAFCLMPNHYHLLVKQLLPKGLPIFISKIQNGFAKYYNIKNERHGSLFCGMFKVVLIKSDEQFNHVSRYIHLNPVIANIVNIKALDHNPLTSFSSYMENSYQQFLCKKLIHNNFKSINIYKKFVLDQEEYLRKLGEIALNTRC